MLNGKRVMRAGKGLVSAKKRGSNIDPMSQTF